MAERDDFTKQLNDLKNEARGREKKVRTWMNILQINIYAKLEPSIDSYFSCAILILFDGNSLCQCMYSLSMISSSLLSFPSL